MANRRFIDFPIASTSGDTDIILIWQGGVNKQTTKATFLSGLPENLDELNDVAISGLTNGQILRYDSTTGKWENTDQGNLDLNDLNDVSIVSPSNGQVLVYNSSTSKWENSSGGFVPYVGAVTTVNLGAQTIQAGQFVKAGGTSSQFLKADGSIDSTAYGTGSVTSVGLTMPSAFSVANSPVTTAGTLAVTGAGTVSQYIRGDGSLADFPESSGGGSSVSYYLNGSVNQGTIGGVAYKELSKVPILGAGTDFTINANGYIASFLTDAGDPNLLEIPGGNWNFETYFSASSGGGSPTFYVELYKYDGTTFTLIASNSTFPELIAFGTNVISYFSTLAVPTTALALTDRLAIRYYVTHSGRTITLHTEDNHLCQIITTFTTGITALNGLTAQVQNFAVGTSGTDFAISSATATHTFNLPTASATNRGALSSADWTTFNNKQNALTNPVTGTGTNNYLPKFTGLTTIGDSAIADNTNEVNISKRIFLNSGGQSIFFTPNLSGVSNRIEGSSGIPLEIFTGGSALRLGAGGSSTQINLASTGVVTMSNLAGTGSRIVVADSSGNLSASSALSGYIQGSGTTNYLPKFTGASTIGNSQIFDNGTNVGIGTASPSSKLEIVGDAEMLNLRNSTTSTITGRIGVRTDGAMQIYSFQSGVSYKPVIFGVDGSFLSAGNVLIGTTTDNGARLQVSGSSYFSQQVNIPNNIDIAFGTNTGNYIGQYYNGTDLLFYNGTGGASFFGINRGTGAATFSSSVTANVGSLSGSFGLNVNVNSTFAFGSTNGRRTGTITRDSGDKPGLQFGYDATDNTGILAGATESLGAGLDFYTYNGSSWGNRMRITSGGNVGIGTTTFAYSPRLAVSSVGQNSIAIQTTDTVQGSAGTILYLGTGASTGSSTYGQIVPLGNGGTSAANLVLQPTGSNGNVLIGTTTDNGARLQVSGTATFSGNVRINTNTTGVILNRDAVTNYNGIGYWTAGIGKWFVGMRENLSSNNYIIYSEIGTDVLTLNQASGAATFSSLGTGTVYSNGGTLTNTNPSDLNLKENIAPINYGLSEILQLNAVTFNWKNDTINQGKQYGFIAQEVQKIMPDLVKKGEYLGLDKEAIFTTLVKAIQELKQEIDTLKN